MSGLENWRRRYLRQRVFLINRLDFRDEVKNGSNSTAVRMSPLQHFLVHVIFWKG